MLCLYMDIFLCDVYIFKGVFFEEGINNMDWILRVNVVNIIILDNCCICLDFIMKFLDGGIF